MSMNYSFHKCFLPVIYLVYFANSNHLPCTFFLYFYIIDVLFHKDINDVNISILDNPIH